MKLFFRGRCPSDGAGIFQTIEERSYRMVVHEFSRIKSAVWYPVGMDGYREGQQRERSWESRARDRVHPWRQAFENKDKNNEIPLRNSSS